MFPGAGAQVYRNEAGEPLGWDYPSEPDFDPFDGLDDREDDRFDGGCIDCGEEAVIDSEFCADCLGETQEAPIREDFGHFGDEALCGE